jgi:hypothetical protein
MDLALAPKVMEGIKPWNSRQILICHELRAPLLCFCRPGHRQID